DHFDHELRCGSAVGTSVDRLQTSRAVGGRGPGRWSSKPYRRDECGKNRCRHDRTAARLDQAVQASGAPLWEATRNRPASDILLSFVLPERAHGTPALP